MTPDDPPTCPGRKEKSFVSPLGVGELLSTGFQGNARVKATGSGEDNVKSVEYSSSEARSFELDAMGNGSNLLSAWKD